MLVDPTDQLRASVLDLPPALEDRIADREQHDVDRQQRDPTDVDRRIRFAKEAVAEAGDDVEEGVGVADGAERRRQLFDRIEGTAEQG